MEGGLCSLPHGFVGLLAESLCGLRLREGVRGERRYSEGVRGERRYSEGGEEVQ